MSLDAWRAAAHPRRRVAVVGAGPAGCAAAIALRHASVDVVLLERGAPGKDKPCGDACLPAAVALLRDLGIDAPRLAALGGVPIAHIDLYGCESRFLRRAIGTGVAWMIPRAALDQALREAAAEQATVWYDTVVRDLRPAETDGSWRLTIQQGTATRPLVCDGVILACGSRTRLAAPWGISGEPMLGASITAYARGPDSDALLFQFIEALQPGYGWVFAMAGQRVNLGVCALRPAAVRGLRRHASAYAARWHVGQPCPWRGGAEALWSGRSQRWHHGAGIVSCGDAAGLVDPSTGEGITAALLSGQRAGAALSLYLRAGRDMRHLQDYSAWVASHFGSVYRSTPVRRLWEGLCGL